MSSFENAKTLLKKTNIRLTGIYSSEQLLELAKVAVEYDTHLTISDKAYGINLLSQMADVAGRNLTLVE